VEELKTIGWFISTLSSIWLIFAFVGMNGITDMFPEGKRWWHLPAQLGTIAFFAVMVLLHPF